MSFQIHPLPVGPFEHLFGADKSTLAAYGVTRLTAQCAPGYPCRISLQDAHVGESVLLLNYEHQPHDTPYRARHAIFIREDAKEAVPAAGEVPESISRRLISLRVFNQAHVLITADVAQGDAVRTKIETLFAHPDADYIHLHNAKPGCYAAQVTRSP